MVFALVHTASLANADSKDAQLHIAGETLGRGAARGHRLEFEVKNDGADTRTSRRTPVRVHTSLFDEAS